MSEEFVIPLDVWIKADTVQRQEWLDEGCVMSIEDALKLEATSDGTESSQQLKPCLTTKERL